MASCTALVSLGYTVLRDTDGHEVIVPNSVMATSIVIRIERAAGPTASGRVTVPLRSRFGWALAGAIAMSTAFACGSTQNQTIRLGNADADRTVGAAVGDEIDVTLQTIGPGQYGDPSVSSGAAVFLGESPVGPALPAGPTQLFRFEAVARGRADLTIPHAGEAPGGPVVPPFSITIQVD